MDAVEASRIDAIFRRVERTIWIVTAIDGPRRGGLLATWVAQTSLDPLRPVVMAALAPNHFTTELVIASGALGLHLITDERIELAWRFAIGSGRDHDKLAGLPTKVAVTGTPLLAESLAWLDCRVFHRYDGGDRIYFWADVVAAGSDAEGTPLTDGALFAAASDDQKRQLKANLAEDIELLRPLGERWRESI
jgi:flavin reductase (DIM6/NTAB) family NADH-FMN oxidoreductase RutF